jgi:hypothetical protein
MKPVLPDWLETILKGLPRSIDRVTVSGLSKEIGAPHEPRSVRRLPLVWKRAGAGRSRSTTDTRRAAEVLYQKFLDAPAIVTNEAKAAAQDPQARQYPAQPGVSAAARTKHRAGASSRPSDTEIPAPPAARVAR